MTAGCTGYCMAVTAPDTLAALDTFMVARCPDVHTTVLNTGVAVVTPVLIDPDL